MIERRDSGRVPDHSVLVRRMLESQFSDVSKRLLAPVVSVAGNVVFRLGGSKLAMPRQGLLATGHVPPTILYAFARDSSNRRIRRTDARCRESVPLVELDQRMQRRAAFATEMGSSKPVHSGCGRRRRTQHLGGRAVVGGRTDRVHGDLLPGDVLLEDGDLAAVLNFGCSGVGDPAWDVTGARLILHDRIGDAETVQLAVLAAARGAGIVAVVDTESPLGRALVDDLARLGPVRQGVDTAEETPDAVTDLVPEQRALLDRLAAGDTIAAAAAAEFLSLRTANRRIAEARALFGVRTTREAVLAYLRQRGPR